MSDSSDPSPVLEHCYTCIGCGYSLNGLNVTRCPECGRAILAADIIDTYRGNNLGLQSTFALCPDRVVVYQKWMFRGDALESVRLLELSPDASFIRIRSKGFQSGLTIAVSSAVFLVVYFVNPKEVGLTPLAIAAVGFSLGLAIAAFNYKRTEVVQFSTRFGGRVRLMLPRKGRDVERLDSFVLKLSEQIEKAVAI